MKNEMIPNQLEAFQEYKKANKDLFKNLTPLNVIIQNFNKNKFIGANKAPYFSIDRRYTIKKITSKKKEDK